MCCEIHLEWPSQIELVAPTLLSVDIIQHQWLLGFYLVLLSQSQHKHKQNTSEQCFDRSVNCQSDLMRDIWRQTHLVSIKSFGTFEQDSAVVLFFAFTFLNLSMCQLSCGYTQNIFVSKGNTSYIWRWEFIVTLKKFYYPRKIQQ